MRCSRALCKSEQRHLGQVLTGSWLNASIAPRRSESSDPTQAHQKCPELFILCLSTAARLRDFEIPSYAVKTSWASRAATRPHQVASALSEPKLRCKADQEQGISEPHPGIRSCRWDWVEIWRVSRRFGEEDQKEGPPKAFENLGKCQQFQPWWTHFLS